MSNDDFFRDATEVFMTLKRMEERKLELKKDREVTFCFLQNEMMIKDELRSLFNSYKSKTAAPQKLDRKIELLGDNRVN